MANPQRSRFAKFWSLDEKTVFLNHGSFGACPDFVIEEQQKWRDLLELEPVRFYERIAPDALHSARVALGKFINCNADDLAFVANATSGVNTVLRSLQFEKGDEILVPDHAYQACRNAIDFVAEHWGAKVIVCNIPFPAESIEQVLDAVLSKVTNQTKLAMIDTVTSPTGLLMPFEELSKELESRGVQVLLDAAHGPGMVPLDLEALGASYVTGNCHKWLCAPKGSAFLYVRNDLQEDIHPLSISHGRTFPLGDITRFRHEFDWVGTRDVSQWCSLPEVIEGMTELGAGDWNQIMSTNRSLTLQGRRLVCDAIGAEIPCPDEMIASIATLQISKEIKGGIPLHEPDPLHEILLDEHGIQVPVWGWPSPEGRYIRISAQLYNHIDEYRYLAETLSKLDL
jgi:isopenicillin-N epimerase